MTAIHPKLDSVTTDEFALRMGLISNPRAIHRRLQLSPEVHDIREALSSGEITENSVRQFIADLLRQYVPGQLFPHEIALSAIAVAIETRAGALASEVIQDLARLELAELPIAIRVAREAMAVQSSLTGNKSRLVTMLPLPVQQHNPWQLQPVERPVEVGQVDKEFEFEGS